MGLARKQIGVDWGGSIYFWAYFYAFVGSYSRDGFIWGFKL